MFGGKDENLEKYLILGMIHWKNQKRNFEKELDENQRRTYGGRHDF